MTKDTKVRSGPIADARAKHGAGWFSYPDLLVVCGEIEFHDAFKDVILNPRLILEVLSPSTENFDRDEKFERYKKWNPSLTDYLLVSQDAAIDRTSSAPGGRHLDPADVLGPGRRFRHSIHTMHHRTGRRLRSGRLGRGIGRSCTISTF